MAYYILTAVGGKHRAQVRVKHNGKVVRTETRTFQRRTAAETWAKRRVLELEEKSPGALAGERLTVGKMIEKYVEAYAAIGRWGRTKTATLDKLRRSSLADVSLANLTTARLVQHVIDRRKEVGPATAANDLIWLRVVAKAARAAWSAPVSLAAIEDAVTHCRQERLTARSAKRTRRPTDDELARLTAYFDQRDRRGQIPMHDIMWFAIHSARREAEICRLEWDDNDDRDHTGLVRDLKHPGGSKGNDRRFKYTPTGWAIVQRQPHIEGKPRIFPYDAKSVSTAFTRACKVLEIPDLRFHDLRHEATSRLFEVGYSIVQVQQFTLHESWDMLKRYVQLRPGDVQHRTSRDEPLPSPGPDTSPDRR